MPRKQGLGYFLEASSIGIELENRGYRRSALTWRRIDGQSARVVDFQRSKFSEPGTERFTLNLGVALDNVWRAYSGEGLSGTIHEADCFPRFRVGDAIASFRQDAADVWWSISEGGDTAQLAAAVKSALFERCIPILDRLNTTEAVLRFVREEAPPRHANAPFTRIVLAILHHFNGDDQIVASLMEELETRRELGIEWRSRVRDVRDRLKRGRDIVD